MLISSQMIPIITAGVGMFVIEDSLICLALILGQYILLPLVYIRYLSKEQEIKGIYGE